jgi:hypothetical protein
MSLTAKKIVAEALALPGPLRAYVAERLIESLDSEKPAGLSPKWHEEVVKRCGELDEGLVELLPADEVFSKAYDELT